MNKDSPIDDLYTDAGPFDLATATAALKPLVMIQRDTHEIHFKPEARKLSVEAKIIAYALAKKLLATEHRVDTGFISAMEFHTMTGIKKGTVDPAFQRLKRAKEGFLIGSGSKYEIPQYKVPEIIEFLNNPVGQENAK